MTLFGAIKDPSTACKPGQEGQQAGTLVNKLPGARSCAHTWTGEPLPLAQGAPVAAPGAPSLQCPGS